MAVNINEAQSIVKKLSSEQLIESYKNGSLPQFIVFSEMKSRQDMMKTQPQMPTQTVAESMAGSRDEEPVMAARGGRVYSKMPREIDYYSSLTDAQKKMIASRELPDELSALIAQQTRPDRDYNLARAESYLKDARDSTETFRKGGEVEEPPVPMSGEEFANAHIRGIIMAESDGVHIDPKTGKLLESPAGAKGITQIMDKTARDPGYGIKPKRDDSRDAAIDFSKDFLKTSYNLFKDPDQSITAYNTGISGVQEAINKANKYGGHWRQYLPNDESKNYYGKVIGKAQLDLPPRQDMAGADTYEPAPVYDNAFLPRGATANDVGIMKNAPGSDKLGSAAYLIKEALKMREGKKEGGPIRLQAGSGASVLRDRQREYLNPYIGRPSYESQIPLPPEPPYDVNESRGDTAPPTDTEEFYRKREAVQSDERTSAFGRGVRRVLDYQPFKVSENTKEQEKIRLLMMENSVSPFTLQTPAQIEEQKRRADELEAERKRIIKSGGSLNPNIRDGIREIEYPGPTIPPLNPPPGQGGTIRNPADPDDIHQRMTPRQAQTIPQAQAPVGASPASIAGTGAGTGPSTGAGSLAGQLAEIKSLMGTSLSNEATNIFARDEKILASMQNDKLVNTLMAASAVLAKQRVGSVNYGEAVATAGMAAQEAQGRIVKTEREMNKTRLELAAAQDDRDFKAITAAMNRLNQLDTTNTQLQVAVYAANRASSTEDRKDARESQRLTEHEKRNQAAIEARNINSQREKLSTIISNMNTNIRRMKEPGSVATDPEIAEQERILNGYLSQFNSLSPSGETSPSPILNLGQAIQNEQNKRAGK